MESIKAKGVLSPAIARKRPEGGFELISGHRRTHAARRAGLDKIPVFVKDYSDDEAVCIMVDSNIQHLTECLKNAIEPHQVNTGKTKDEMGKGIEVGNSKI